jgi:hypothetical protein
MACEWVHSIEDNVHDKTLKKILPLYTRRRSRSDNCESSRVLISNSISLQQTPYLNSSSRFDSKGGCIYSIWFEELWTQSTWNWKLFSLFCIIILTTNNQLSRLVLCLILVTSHLSAFDFIQTHIHTWCPSTLSTLLFIPFQFLPMHLLPFVRKWHAFYSTHFSSVLFLLLLHFTEKNLRHAPYVFWDF